MAVNQMQPKYPLYIQEGTRIASRCFAKGVLGYMTACVIPFRQWNVTGWCGGVMMATAVGLDSLCNPIFNKAVNLFRPITNKISPRASEDCKAIAMFFKYIVIGLVATQVGRVVTGCDANMMDLGLIAIASPLTVIWALGAADLLQSSNEEKITPELLAQMPPELRQKWEKMINRSRNYVKRSLQFLDLKDDQKAKKFGQELMKELDELARVAKECHALREGIPDSATSS